MEPLNPYYLVKSGEILYDDYIDDSFWYERWNCMKRESGHHNDAEKISEKGRSSIAEEYICRQTTIGEQR